MSECTKDQETHITLTAQWFNANLIIEDVFALQEKKIGSSMTTVHLFYQLNSPAFCLEDTNICAFQNFKHKCPFCPFAPPYWLSFKDSIKQTGPVWPPTNCFPARDLQTPLALWDLVKTKQLWQPLTVSRIGAVVCVCVCVHAWWMCVFLLDLSRNWEKQQERKNKRDHERLMAFPQGHHLL